MRNRYLLYMDILGFSNNAIEDTLQVRRIHKIIEELNTHHHDAFKFILFPDTILIYNINEPLTGSERDYYVMFLIEFAQKLLYEFSGKKLFFRALLVNGEFEHIASGRFEKFFGRALVRVKEKEKTIKCCGLFIDNESQKNNEIFPVARHDKDVSFVYLNQSLDRFYSGELGGWPIDADLLKETDSAWHLAKDNYFLRDVFTLMNKNSHTGVRSKMKTTWNYYENRYPKLMCDLVSQNFDLSVFSEGFDWTETVSRINEGYKGFSRDIPSLDELREIIEESRHRGSLAANKRFKEIYGNHILGKKCFSPCGGGMVILDVDGRTRLGRLLSAASKEIDTFSLWKSRRGGYIVSIGNMHSRQERDVGVAASKAALEVLQERLGVIGHVEEYYD